MIELLEYELGKTKKSCAILLLRYNYLRPLVINYNFAAMHINIQYA